jgi:hypothetical protein
MRFSQGKQACPDINLFLVSASMSLSVGACVSFLSLSFSRDYTPSVPSLPSLSFCLVLFLFFFFLRFFFSDREVMMSRPCFVAREHPTAHGTGRETEKLTGRKLIQKERARKVCHSSMTTLSSTITRKGSYKLAASSCILYDACHYDSFSAEH